MRDFRLQSLEIFESKPMPTWGGDLSLDFQDIYYYLKPTDHQARLGTMCLRRSKIRSTSWASPKLRKSISLA